MQHKARSNLLLFFAGMVLGGGLMVLVQQPLPLFSNPVRLVKRNILPKRAKPPPYFAPVPALILNPNLVKPRHKQIMQFGLPNPTQLQLKDNFIAFIDNRNKGPIWVMEHLTRENIKAGGERKLFTEDKDVLPQFRAKFSDYSDSGYSRGHMSPASNNKGSPESLFDSYLLNTNVVPQNFDNNMNYWARMENWVQILVKTQQFSDLHVLSGPLFLPSATSFEHAKPASSSTTSKGGPKAMKLSPPLEHSALLLPPPSDVYAAVPNATYLQFIPPAVQEQMAPKQPFQYMAYKLIGANRVAVPTHLFKAVLGTRGKVHYFACFIVPNAVVHEQVPLAALEVSKETLEKYTGFLLFDQLDFTHVKSMCAATEFKFKLCRMKAASDHQFYHFKRQLEAAASRDDLLRVRKEIELYASQRRILLPPELDAVFKQKFGAL